MPDIPESATLAAAEALQLHEHAGERDPWRERAHVVLKAAAPALAEAVRERIARHVEAIGANYPEEIFPPGSDSRDAISGTAMRHAYRNAARSIREDWEDEP